MILKAVKFPKLEDGTQISSAYENSILIISNVTRILKLFDDSHNMGIEITTSGNEVSEVLPITGPNEYYYNRVFLLDDTGNTIERLL